MRFGILKRNWRKMNGCEIPHWSYTTPALGFVMCLSLSEFRNTVAPYIVKQFYSFY
jgi:hypothetical protein